MGREKRRRYSKQFKVDAVSLVMEQDYGTPEAAKRLGINANMLNRWCREHERRAAGVDSDAEQAEHSEVERLRRRVRELETEREILKKATAFFAKESN